MTQFTASVVADSINGYGNRLTTLQLSYPRFIHAEFMTHRAFSRNASSSRAIPVAKMIEQVRTNPAMPIHWGANQPGMQARTELSDTVEAIQSWKRAARQAADIAEHMAAIGLHKQVANRVLEPFQLMNVVVSATEWSNFFELRDHEDAQPEIRALAVVMKEAMGSSSPVLRSESSSAGFHAWHLPYVTFEERELYRLDILLKASTARCARVSYKNHDQTEPSIKKDIELHDALVDAAPLHASPTEHAACGRGNTFQKNFKGWKQYRAYVEAGDQP